MADHPNTTEYDNIYNLFDECVKQDKLDILQMSYDIICKYNTDASNIIKQTIRNYINTFIADSEYIYYFISHMEIIEIAYSQYSILSNDAISAVLHIIDINDYKDELSKQFIRQISMVDIVDYMQTYKRGISFIINVFGIKTLALNVNNI